MYISFVFLFHTVKKKFCVPEGEDFVFVDEDDGSAIDEDVLQEIVACNPALTLMVLNEDEKWGKYMYHCHIQP